MNICECQASIPVQRGFFPGNGRVSRVLLQVGPSPSSAPRVGSGRTDVPSAQSLHTPECWRERRNPDRLQGTCCIKIKGLALPQQQLSLRAHRGRCCGFGEVLNLWVPSAPASPSRAGNSCSSSTALGRDVAPGSPLRQQRAHFHFHQGHPGAGLELPAAAPLCWLQTSRSTGAFISQLVLQNVSF